MDIKVSFRSLVEYAIGGGWGSEEPVADAVPVVIIRGTDFSGIRSLAFESVPRRFESSRKVNNRLLRTGDIVLEISGGSRTSNQSTGRTLLITQQILDEFEQPVIPASFCRLVRLNRALIDPRYGYYALQDMYLSGRVQGYEQHSTGISNFQFEYFLDQEKVRIPPLAEQRAIAHILGSLDDKIDLNRRMNRTLEEIARALFQSWFVDFDPVHAHARGEAMPGLDPALDALFPAAFEDSALGPIPVGWRVGTVGEGFHVTMGQSPPGSTYNEEGDGLPFFQGRRDFGDRFPNRRVYCTAPTRLAAVGDTLVSVRAPVGSLNMADDTLCIGRGLAAVRHITSSRSYTYYSMMFLADEFNRFEGEGTVFGSINQRDFLGIVIVHPPEKIVVEFERIVAPLDEMYTNNHRESRTLAALRDTLLPKLMSGELRVAAAAEIAEAAA